MRLTVSIDWQYPGILHVNTERSSYTKAWKQTARHFNRLCGHRSL